MTNNTPPDRSNETQGNLLTGLLDAESIAIITTSRQHKILLFNRGAEILFGYRKEEILGNCISIIVPDFFSDNSANNVLPGRKLHQIFARQKTGEVLPCNVEISIHKNRSEELLTFVFHETSELTRIEEKIKHMDTQLQQAQKLSTIGQLTTGIVHDFNNILAALIGFSTMARDSTRKNENPRLSLYLDKVLDAGIRGRDLIDHLLKFIRPGNNGHGTQRLDNSVTESLKLVRVIIPKSIIITTDIQTIEPHIKLDPVHVYQLVMNLCINARDSIKVTGNISVNLRHVTLHRGIQCHSCSEYFSGEYIVLSVSDTGEGITENKIKNIFKLFYTTKENGTGMGLSLVKDIMHEYQGHILVESRPEVGTLFRLYFPVITTKNFGGSNQKTTTMS